MSSKKVEALAARILAGLAAAPVESDWSIPGMRHRARLALDQAEIFDVEARKLRIDPRDLEDDGTGGINSL